MTRKHDKTYLKKQAERGLVQIKPWVPKHLTRWFLNLASASCQIHKDAKVTPTEAAWESGAHKEKNPSTLPGEQKGEG